MPSFSSSGRIPVEEADDPAECSFGILPRVPFSEFDDPADIGEWSGCIEGPGSLEGYVDSTHRYLQYLVVMDSGGRFIIPSHDVVTFLWDWLGVEGSEDVTLLHPVTPNPCYGPVELRFSLAEPGPLTLRVFDLCGRLVALPVDGEVSGGGHSVQLAYLPPGAYFVRMTAGKTFCGSALFWWENGDSGGVPLNGDEPEPELISSEQVANWRLVPLPARNSLPLISRSSESFRPPNLS